MLVALHSMFRAIDTPYSNTPLVIATKLHTLDIVRDAEPFLNRFSLAIVAPGRTLTTPTHSGMIPAGGSGDWIALLLDREAVHRTNKRLGGRQADLPAVRSG